MQPRSTGSSGDRKADGQRMDHDGYQLPLAIVAIEPQTKCLGKSTIVSSSWDGFHMHALTHNVT